MRTMHSLSLVLVVFFFVAGCYAQFDCPAGSDCSGQCEAVSAAKLNPLGNITNIAFQCPYGYLCYEDQPPVLCPRRYYCPDAVTKIRCPANYYCQTGTVTPRKCPPGAVCDSGSWQYIHVLAIMLMIVTTIGILVIHFIISKGTARLKPLIELSDFADKEANKNHKTSLTFSFQDLQVMIKEGNAVSKLWGPERYILQGASGRFDSGRLAAVMGPSGAGKTTFMNVLLGKVPLTGGSLQVNGRNLKDSNIRTSIGYVPQEDIMIREYATVKEILTHSAVSRLPSTWTRQQIDAKVIETIRVLKLEHIQNNYIGDELVRGISGGERKRVNIGMELVADPIALLCDEPTSGLDTTSAYDVMLFLRQVARDLNMTVIVVLHQPRHEIFDMCDDLLLLGKGGYTTYIGAIEKATPYFDSLGYPCPEHVNPADHYIDVVSGKTVDSPSAMGKPALEYLVESWQSNKDAFAANDKSESSDLPKPMHAPFYRQFSSFARRNFLLLFRDIKGRLLDNFLHMIAGAIIAMGFFIDEMYVPPIPRSYLPLCPASIAGQFCWYPQTATISRLPGYATMAIGLAAATIGARTFYNERTIFWREKSSGMNSLIYFLANNVVDLVPIFFYSLSFTIAFIAIASPQGSFGGYWGIVICYEFCLYAIGYITTWLSETNPSVLAVIVALVSGLGTQAVGVPFMWSMWASEGLVLNELNYEDQPIQVRTLAQDYIKYLKYRTKSGQYGQDILALILIGIGLRLLAYIAMRAFTRLRGK